MAVIKIDFESTVKSGKKKSVMSDSIRVHLTDPSLAETLFAEWMELSTAIRGDSGIFHPLRVRGTCVFKKASVVNG